MTLPALIEQARKVAEAATENGALWEEVRSAPSLAARQDACLRLGWKHEAMIHIATFDPPTVLALLDVVEAAEELHIALAYQEPDPHGVSEASGEVGAALDRLAATLAGAEDA